MLAQIDETTVRSDEGYSVSILDERTVVYREGPNRSLHFEINVQCCGGIQFVLHTFPTPEHWDRSLGEDRVPLTRAQYESIVKRVRNSLEYLKLDFAVD